MKKSFGYLIDVEPLSPPVGGVYLFVAKAVHVYEKAEGGKRTVIPSPIGDVWGTTAEEARSKCDEKMKDWIADQNK